MFSWFSEFKLPPSNAECFYLRMLLHEVHGPRSFDDLKPSTGICVKLTVKRGERQSYWLNTMEKAASSQMSRQLRQLIATCG